MPNLKDYTVGWICTAQTEYTAAKTFFDEEHDPPDQRALSHRDYNDYSLGVIQGHKVVMAISTPRGYGKSSSVSSFASMRMSFPNIQYGLMVGISGGAPTYENDIRLGDVVVSSPEDGSPGANLYDVVNGFLDPPPLELRSAISGLSTKYSGEGHHIDRTIASILQTKPQLEEEFSRPARESDRLFASDFVHMSEATCDESCVTQLEKIITRRVRQANDDDPHIHYGTIHSCYQLMKDAPMRDRYAVEKNILCFGVETACYEKPYQCLVLRGICDYSDSHKSEVWQGYAAMAAAAYAKDLLGEIEAHAGVYDARTHETRLKDLDRTLEAEPKNAAKLVHQARDQSDRSNQHKLDLDQLQKASEASSAQEKTDLVEQLDKGLTRQQFNLDPHAFAQVSSVEAELQTLTIADTSRHGTDQSRATNQDSNNYINHNRRNTDSRTSYIGSDAHGGGGSGGRSTPPPSAPQLLQLPKRSRFRPARGRAEILENTRRIREYVQQVTEYCRGYEGR
jgi:nucleoside phosphorylase